VRLKSIIILLVIALALGGYFYFSSIPEPLPEEKPQLYVWLIEMEEIQHVEIKLPREGASQAFIKEEDRSWHFDDPQRTDVDMRRWGGGIPLLLSGPGTNRVISENTTQEKLAEFGLALPQMEVILTLEDGYIMNIKVGDSTPDGINYYVQAPDSSAVALVDFTWFEVLARLVREPPYVPIAEE